MPQCTLCTILANSYQPWPWATYRSVQDSDEERDLESDLTKDSEECLHHSTVTVIASVASVVSVARLHRVAALIFESSQHNSTPPPPPVLAYLLPLFCFLLGVTCFCQARFLAGDVHTPKWLLAGLLLGVSVGYADGVDLVQLSLSYVPCSVLLLLGLSLVVGMHAERERISAASSRCCVARLAGQLAVPLDGLSNLGSRREGEVGCRQVPCSKTGEFGASFGGRGERGGV